MATVVALMAAGCSGGSDDDGAAADSGPAAPHEVSFDVLATNAVADGQVVGTAIPVTVRVTDRDDEESVRVEVSDDQNAGTDDQWQAAAWQAVTTATLVTGAPLVGREVDFEVSGSIDGPGAGAALTVGVLAAMRGDALDPNVVVTGTITPDGTIGPAGGLPEKLRALAQRVGTTPDEEAPDDDASDPEANDNDSSDDNAQGDGSDGDGFRDADIVVLIPAGQREVQDFPEGEPGELADVDMVELGEDLGLEVREVSDIYEAYADAAGEELARLDGGGDGDGGDTDLDEEGVARVEPAVQEWLDRYGTAAEELATLGTEGAGFVLETGLSELAAEAASGAGDLNDDGLVAGAYDQARRAAAYAAAALSVGRGWEVGTELWSADLTARQEVCGDLAAATAAVAAVMPETVNDASGLIAAYASLIDAASLCSQAGALIEAAAADSDPVFALVNASWFLDLADVFVVSAQDHLGFVDGLGGRELDGTIDQATTAEFFGEASAANLAAFDGLVVTEWARNAGVSEEIGRVMFTQGVLDYALVTASPQAVATVGALVDDEADTPYLELGAAMLGYARTSSLLARFASLGVEFDAELQIIGIADAAALEAALDLGEQQLGGTIESLRSQDVDPTAVIGAYETAFLRSEGDISDQFDALSSLWSGFVGGRMLAYLGGIETAGL